MTTVAQVLDMLAAGDMTLPEVEADFAGRTWPKLAPPTIEDAWLGNETADDPNSWATVNGDSRLDSATYQRLAKAAFGSTD